MRHLIKATGKNADKNYIWYTKIHTNPHSILHKERIATNR